MTCSALTFPIVSVGHGAERLPARAVPDREVVGAAGPRVREHAAGVDLAAGDGDGEDLAVRDLLRRRADRTPGAAVPLRDAIGVGDPAGVGELAADVERAGVTSSAEATRFSDLVPGVPRSPRWSQPPGPAASAHVASMPMASAETARTRRPRAEMSRPIRSESLPLWEAGAGCASAQTFCRPTDPTPRRLRSPPGLSHSVFISATGWMLVSSSVPEPVFSNRCAAPAGTTTVCAAARDVLRPVDGERRLAVGDDEHLRVGVPVQRRAAPRLHVDEHERGVDAVLVPVERLRAASRSRGRRPSRTRAAPRSHLPVVVVEVARPPRHQPVVRASVASSLSLSG